MSIPLTDRLTDSFLYNSEKRLLLLEVLLLFLVAPRLIASEQSPAGIVVGWGANVSGQATGTPEQSIGVVMIAGQVLTNATAVAVGMNHSLAIRSDGTVVGWGNNGRGQAAGAATEYPGRSAGAVSIKGHVLSNVVAIAAGWIHSHALLSNGTIVAWGTQMDGREIRVPANLSNVVSIAGWWSLAAKGDGSLVNILNGESYSGTSNIVAVAAPRADHGDLVALQRDGVVVGIRLATPHSVSVVTSNATTISAGQWQHLALKRDGTVFAWGGDSRVPPGLSNVVAISAGQYHSLALRSDGTVVAWGATDRPAASVPVGLSNVVAIAAGNDFSLAITTNPVVAARFLR